MKIFEGVIISVGMKNTVTVSVERKVPHPLYGKLMKRNKKYLVDSEGFELNIGDRVRIIETKPVSKNKYFKIVEMTGGKNLKNKTEVKKADKKSEAKEKEKPVKRVTKTRARTRKETK